MTTGGMIAPTTTVAKAAVALEDLCRSQPAGLKVLRELLAAEHSMQLGEERSRGVEDHGAGLRDVDQLSRVAVPEEARDRRVGVKDEAARGRRRG